MAWATQLPIPQAQASNPLTRQQTDALTYMVTNPDELYAEVTRRLQHWTTRKEQLHQVNTMYREKLDPTLQGTLGRLDLFLLEELLNKSKYHDQDYVKDLAEGFPITGSLPSGNCGVPIPGGQRVHGRPGLGGPEPLDELRAQCFSINEATLRSATAKIPTTELEWELAEKSWSKLAQDIDRGFAGHPIELDLSLIHI